MIFQPLMLRTPAEGSCDTSIEPGEQKKIEVGGFGRDVAHTFLLCSDASTRRLRVEYIEFGRQLVVIPAPSQGFPTGPVGFPTIEALLGIDLGPHSPHYNIAIVIHNTTGIVAKVRDLFIYGIETTEEEQLANMERALRKSEDQVAEYRRILGRGANACRTCNR